MARCHNDVVQGNPEPFIGTFCGCTLVELSTSDLDREDTQALQDAIRKIREEVPIKVREASREAQGNSGAVTFGNILTLGALGNGIAAKENAAIEAGIRAAEATARRMIPGATYQGYTEAFEMIPCTVCGLSILIVGWIVICVFLGINHVVVGGAVAAAIISLVVFCFFGYSLVSQVTNPSIKQRIANEIADNAKSAGQKAADGQSQLQW